MIGGAANYIGKLSEEQRARYHWIVAIRMLEEQRACAGNV
jgi:hypothetical protein